MKQKVLITDIRTKKGQKIFYKYKNKEIGTPASEGYLTDFQKIKDWIEWLQKEFEISKEDWKKKQMDILFKSKGQPEYDKLMYTDKEAFEKGWMEEGEKLTDRIDWPPIYLHPLIEDWLKCPCDCGHIAIYNIRKIKEYFKKQIVKDNKMLVRCKKCGKFGTVDKDCVYRVCEDRMGEGRKFWIEAWKQLGIKLWNKNNES